jgi:CDP-glucose 4,6-dehydratase
VTSRLAAWAGHRVFVTGHTGFVGSWLTATLLRLGAAVVGFASSADEHMKERERWLGDLGATCLRGDVRRFDELSAALAGAPFDTVVHLAAQSLVSVGYSRPRETLDTNIRGSINLMEAARLYPPKVLLHVTSDKCYRNQHLPRAYHERDALGGGCPYSVSKAAAELVFEGYADLYRAAPQGPRAASVRFGNIIGGGDHGYRRLVPECLTALAAGQPIQLRQPDAVRPWQHVMDVVHGLLLLADGLRSGAVPAGDVFNFAPPGDRVTTTRLATALAHAWGGGSVTTAPAADFPEDQVLRLDGRRAATATGWRHLLDVDAAAEWIVRWERAAGRTSSGRDATLEQIDEFLGSTQALRQPLADHG